jgi:DNA-binding NtrC family response regulator
MQNQTSSTHKMTLSKTRRSRAYTLACEADSNVLLTGATGTGKTSLAREIHERSKRRDKPFVVINLATLHEGTIESELFGRERGAYTGADFKRVGKLELAQGGTVFLDEIGELPVRIQARLLEFLQSRTITPMGSNREVRLDVRIIAATHQPLARKVRDGSFREDLFHRLRVIELDLPSISDLSEHFGEILHGVLADVCRMVGKSVHRMDPEVADRFEAYAWPGNFRELRNVLEFAVQVCSDHCLSVADLPEWFLNSGSSSGDAPSSTTGASMLGVIEFKLDSDFYACMTAMEREYLRRALAKVGGRLNLTARTIGMNKTTLLRRVRDLGIHPGTPGEGDSDASISAVS